MDKTFDSTKNIVNNLKVTSCHVTEQIKNSATSRT